MVSFCKPSDFRFTHSVNNSIKDGHKLGGAGNASNIGLSSGFSLPESEVIKHNLVII